MGVKGGAMITYNLQRCSTTSTTRADHLPFCSLHYVTRTRNSAGETRSNRIQLLMKKALKLNEQIGVAHFQRQ